MEQNCSTWNNFVPREGECDAIQAGWNKWGNGPRMKKREMLQLLSEKSRFTVLLSAMEMAVPMRWKPVGDKCSFGCGRPRRSGQRLCLQCHRAYMRKWRAIHRRVRKEVVMYGC